MSTCNKKSNNLATHATTTTSTSSDDKTNDGSIDISCNNIMNDEMIATTVTPSSSTSPTDPTNRSTKAATAVDAERESNSNNCIFVDSDSDDTADKCDIITKRTTNIAKFIFVDSDSDEEDEEWDIKKASDDPEHIYAKDIQKYDSNRSESESGFSSDESDDDEEFETWILSNRNSKTKRSRKGNGRGKNNNKRRRSQTIRNRTKFQSIEALPMPTNDEKQEILNKIKSVDFTCVGNYEKCESDDTWNQAEVYACKFLQNLLWDYDFRYILLPHQYVAVFSVAGVNIPNLLHLLRKLKDEDYEKLVSCSNDGVKMRKELCALNLTFLETKGILLADVMGLGKTVSVSLTCEMMKPLGFVGSVSTNILVIFVVVVHTLI